MTIKKADVKKMARLSKISLSEDEIFRFQKDLSNILHMMDAIKNINTDAIEPLAHPTSTYLHTREDKVSEENKREVLLKLAPQSEAGMYQVPTVIE